MNPAVIQEADVVVVGGGPGGLLLATLLGRLGLQVFVVERGARGQEPPAYVTPMLQPISLKLLEMVDVLDEVTRYSPRITRGEVYKEDVLLASADLNELPQGLPPFAAPVLIRDLRAALTSRLPENVTVLYNSDSHVARESGEFSLDVRDQTDGRAVRLKPGLLVASDGKTSQTRSALGISAATTSFPSGYTELRLPRPAASGPHTMLSRRLPAGHFFTAPMPNDEQMVVWIRPEDGLERLDTSNIIKMIEVGLPELPGSLLWRARNTTTTWAHAIVRPARWAEANSVLLGDSAHGLHAHGGQGVNFALQDAAVLAGIISQGRAPSSSDAIAFERVRRPYVTAFQDFQEASLERDDIAATCAPVVPSFEDLAAGPPHVAEHIANLAAALAKGAQR